MQIIRNFQNINKELSGTVLTLGNFDGIHLGHQTILNDIKEIAKSYNAKSALLTFEPHPIKIIKPERAIDIRLQSLEGKLRFLRKENLVEVVFLVGFNQKLADLKAEDFVKTILVDQLKIKHLAIGYDFAFGKNREGNIELLEKLSNKYGFGITKIGAKNDASNQIYSSSKIRELIKSGEIKLANSMLGRPYRISGVVVSGQKIARNLGFPTANLIPKANLIKPKYGVYKALVNSKYKAIVNFGIRPTFKNNKPLFEVHIFEFNQDLYGKKITVELLDFIREERRFDSIEELQNQIKIDCQIANV